MVSAFFVIPTKKNLNGLVTVTNKIKRDDREMRLNGKATEKMAADNRRQTLRQTNVMDAVK